MRIDKFLWSVRIFKTRSIASDSCKKGKVKINEQNVKSSREMKVNDIFTVRKNPLVYTYKIKDFPKNRVGAKLVSDYLIDLTPKEELEKLEFSKMQYLVRDRGEGRPTKKDRRDLEQLW